MFYFYVLPLVAFRLSCDTLEQNTVLESSNPEGCSLRCCFVTRYRPWVVHQAVVVNLFIFFH